MSVENILKIDGVVKRYAAHTALDGVSLEVPEASIFGLLGPNGAGKTSLLRIVNQITGPDEGSLHFRGEKLGPAHVRQIGYLPEERGCTAKWKWANRPFTWQGLKG